MNDAASSTAESSLLLWALAFTVAMLAVHVSLGWVRNAQAAPALQRSWRALLVASVTLGSGLCAALLLALSAEALPFALGYRAIIAPLLWLGAVLGAAPPLWWLVRSQRWWALLGSALLLAVLMGGLQVGWIDAAGFRPGVRWRPQWVAAAGVLLVLGCSTALWLLFGSAIQASRRRVLWRLGGAAVLGMSLIGSQELLVYGGGVLGQQGSVYDGELPAAVLSLVCGVLLPLVLLVMATDLVMRKRERRHSRSSHSNAFAPRRRRKRRHSAREL